MNKIKVSVGISAYNEELNIKQVLTGILLQTQNSWILEEVLVYCDGCSDRTAEIAKSIGDSKVKVVEFSSRQGKAFRVGELCHNFSGDVLVMFDGDIELANNQVIENLVRTSSKDSQVMLVGGNSQPLTPTTFFQRATFSTFKVFERSRKELHGGNNIFGCTGHCILVKKELARSLNFPNVMNEDDYFYFSCLSNGYKFKHASDAVVYYKLPGNLEDYLRQTFRSDPKAVTLNFRDYFGDLVNKEYRRSFNFMLCSVWREFFVNPFGVMYMVIINLFCIPFFPLVSKRYKLNWFTAQSTK